MAASRKLNPNEEKVLRALGSCGADGISIAALAARCFPDLGSASNAKGNSWVRNSLRKLIRLRYANRVRKGVYALHPDLRTATAAAAAPAAPVAPQGVAVDVDRLPPALARSLAAAARKRRRSIEDTVIELLAESLGAGEAPAAVRGGRGCSS